MTSDDAPDLDLEHKDLLTSAWLLVNAARHAPTPTVKQMETALGPAKVALDGQGADVELESWGATIHVRFDE
ncbi:hypothetical protein GGP53_003159 [Salinibacter ruber]|uniref:hypothetical protein n=1 Tax=Salinibacter ruber TaxID=146919 RepID=UPI002166E3F3|nr:hypothetical protein [Salinibacter ruber]MCS3629279.1 hypothetical protein [Salinibacter ruber]MCS4146187.1 hypothetical protein [Salinibacter ruber]